jgi:hypothetical protein
LGDPGYCAREGLPAEFSRLQRVLDRPCNIVGEPPRDLLCALNRRPRSVPGLTRNVGCALQRPSGTTSRSRCFIERGGGSACLIVSQGRVEAIRSYRGSVEGSLGFGSGRTHRHAQSLHRFERLQGTIGGTCQRF